MDLGPDQIYNVNETAIFLRIMSERTLEPTGVCELKVFYVCIIVSRDMSNGGQSFVVS